MTYLADYTITYDVWETCFYHSILSRRVTHYRILKILACNYINMHVILKRPLQNYFLLAGNHWGVMYRWVCESPKSAISFAMGIMSNATIYLAKIKLHKNISFMSCMFFFIPSGLFTISFHSYLLLC